MKLIDKYIYPSSSRADIAGLRHYDIKGEAKKLPSVTTILSNTQSEEKKEGLRKWRERVGEAEAKRILRESSDRGTAMHYYLEQWIRGRPQDLRHRDLTTTGQEAEPMAEIIVERGLNRVDEVYGIEATLYYPELYAGSCDLIGRIDDKLSIIDFKQTNKPKQKEWVGDYFLQMAAYGMAHDAVYNTAIEQGVILMCSKDGYFQEFVIEGEDFRNAKYAFLKKVDQFYGG
jgi:genome maintenance exonuclease 1